MSDAAGPRATGRPSSGFTIVEGQSALDARFVRFLERLCRSSFFGKVVVSLQNGKIVDVKTEQTRKLEDL